MARPHCLARQVGVLALLAGLPVLTGSCGDVTPPEEAQYEVRLLSPTTGGACCSEALAVNGDGVVVGWNAAGSDPYSLGPRRAFRWSPEQGFEDLGTLGGREAIAYDVNERGDIVGFSTDGAEGRHPVLWAGGVLTDLAAQGSCEFNQCGEATAINDSGWVAGWRPGPTGRRAFLWRNGQMQDLEPSGAFQEVRAINNIGYAVGIGSAGQSFGEGILWDGTRVRFLGSLSGAPYPATTPLAVNDLGQIVGWGFGSDNAARGFLFEDGGLQELPTLGGRNGHASAISRLGEIVGGAQDRGGVYRAVLWRNLQAMALPLPPGAESAQARDINARGIIVGVAVLGDPRPYGAAPVQAAVWTPISALNRGTAALRRRCTRRGCTITSQAASVKCGLLSAME